MHHIVVNTWQGGVDQPQNVVLISIPSVMDPSMAPKGKHCLHAYLPATEPYSIWEGLDRKRWVVAAWLVHVHTWVVMVNSKPIELPFK